MFAAINLDLFSQSISYIKIYTATKKFKAVLHLKSDVKEEGQALKRRYILILQLVFYGLFH
jgi:hypothetical protein